MKRIMLTLCLLVIIQSISAVAQWEHKHQAINERCFIEADGKLYQGFTNGISIYDLQSNERQFITSLNSDLPGNYINSFVLLDDNSILVSTKGGLAVIENGIISVNKPICKNYPDNDARFLYKDENSNLWTFSAKKVHLYKDNVWRTFDLEPLALAFNYEILDLFIDRDEALAMIQNQTDANTTFYFNQIVDLRLSIAKINENGFDELWLNRADFPYRQAGYRFIRVGDELWLQNYDSIYTKKNGEWESVRVFNFGGYKPFFMSGSRFLFKDERGRVWTLLENTVLKVIVPAVYDPVSEEVTVYLEDEEQASLSTQALSDGRIIAWNNQNIYIYDNDKDEWEKKPVASVGIPENCYFGTPRIIDNKLYVILTVIYANNSYDYSYAGTLFCIDDRTSIPRIYQGLPYSTITHLAVNKKGQGIYAGRFANEQLQYEMGDEFVRPETYSNVIPIIAAPDGNVYFSRARDGNTNLHYTLVTWDEQGLKHLQMGFQDKLADYIIGLDTYKDNIILLSAYILQAGNDSVNTTLSIYNFTNKSLTTYDKYNSDLPDYYYTPGIMKIPLDTMPYSASADSEGNIWIITTKSLIKFRDGISVIYDLPKNPAGEPIPFVKIYHDGNTNTILAYNESFQIYNNLYTNKYFYFDVQTSKWDSIETKDAGFVGKFVRMKKMLDGNVWACDTLGYVYQFEGEGKFKIFDLKIHGRPNLGFQINDFMIDVNGYLHLGTDIGLLTNKSILLNIEEQISKSESILVYPNPFNNQIIVNMQNQEVRYLELINIYGQTVSRSQNSNIINTENLSSGMYMLKIGTTNNFEQSVKVIKY